MKSTKEQRSNYETSGKWGENETKVVAFIADLESNKILYDTHPRLKGIIVRLEFDSRSQMETHCFTLGREDKVYLEKGVRIHVIKAAPTRFAVRKKLISEIEKLNFPVDKVRCPFMVDERFLKGYAFEDRRFDGLK